MSIRKSSSKQQVLKIYIYWKKLKKYIPIRYIDACLVYGAYIMNTVLILASVILNCFAQILIRKGMLVNGEIEKLHSLIASIPRMLTNIYLWSAAICYIISILTWMIVLSKVEVSYAYPFLSIGYILATLIGYFWLAEQLSLIRVIGMIIICIGVFLISRS